MYKLIKVSKKTNKSLTQVFESLWELYTAIYNITTIDFTINDYYVYGDVLPMFSVLNSDCLIKIGDGYKVNNKIPKTQRNKANVVALHTFNTISAKIKERFTGAKITPFLAQGYFNIYIDKVIVSCDFGLNILSIKSYSEIEFLALGEVERALKSIFLSPRNYIRLGVNND